MQDALQDLVPNRQNAIDFTAREGRMQEESQLDVFLRQTDLFAKHGR